MKIREIIRESEENISQGKIKEIDILKDIEAAIEFAYKEVKANPELITDPKTSKDTSQTQQSEELEEGIKGTLGKAALAGMIALSGLSAQASQQLGDNLARCGGIMAGIGATMMGSGDLRGQQLFSKGMNAYQLAGQHSGNATQIFGDSQRAMQRGSVESYKRGLQSLEQCHTLINRVFEQESKLAAKQNQARQAYLATPAGKAEAAKALDDGYGWYLETFNRGQTEPASLRSATREFMNATGVNKGAILQIGDTRTAGIGPFATEAEAERVRQNMSSGHPRIFKVDTDYGITKITSGGTQQANTPPSAQQPKSQPVGQSTSTNNKKDAAFNHIVNYINPSMAEAAGKFWAIADRIEKTTTDNQALVSEMRERVNLINSSLNNYLQNSGKQSFEAGKTAANREMSGQSLQSAFEKINAEFFGILKQREDAVKELEKMK